MERPRLTWPLMLTMAVCALVFLSVALQMYASAGIFVMFSMASHPLGWLVLVAVALILLASSFTFARILRRRSTAAARRYLMTIFALSGSLLTFEWQQSDAISAPGVLWLAFIAGLFFSVRPVASDQAEDLRVRDGASTVNRGSTRQLSVDGNE